MIGVTSGQIGQMWGSGEPFQSGGPNLHPRYVMISRCARPTISPRWGSMVPTEFVRTQADTIPIYFAVFVTYINYNFLRNYNYYLFLSKKYFFFQKLFFFVRKNIFEFFLWQNNGNTEIFNL